MGGPALPTLPTAEVAANNTAERCYVTKGAKVYDITPFLEDHPGGGELILEYGGKDVTEIMGDELSHTHSEAAWDVLEDHIIGFIANDALMDIVKESNQPPEIVPLPPTKAGSRELKSGGIAQGLATSMPVFTATGIASAADLSVPTDPDADYRKNRFLDLSKPLLGQVWRGGFSKDFYLEQVHRPRHYKGGASAPLFGNFLEPLTKTPWWVIPTVWLPPVVYGSVLAQQNIELTLSWMLYWLLGLALWTLVEYGLHRGLFHIDNYLPDNRVGITTHFLLHGIHHYLPMDKLRLVMPPTLFIVLATPFYRLAHFVFYWDWYVAIDVFCGGIFGYICYDCTHYFLHHKTLPPYYRELKKYHLQHHFADYNNGFGVSNRFWDRVFGTEIPLTAAKAA